jgi:hypothetical protein
MEEQGNEQHVLKHIQRLVAEEHRLLGHGSLDAAQSTRLTAVQVELDQYWDLLRQRRALHEMGRDAGAAHIRPPEVVEKYVG